MQANKIRKARKKLEILEQEGALELLFDLLDLATEGENQWTPEGKKWLVNTLKSQYKKFIDDNTGGKFKQRSLFED